MVSHSFSRSSLAKRRFCLLMAGMLGGLAAGPSICLADVIYLKNGRTIVAEATREDTSQVHYELGGGEYALPRSLVDHIEKSTAPSAPAAPAERPRQAIRTSDLPLPSQTSAETATADSSPVIKDGAVSESYLRELDDEVIQNPSTENVHRLTQAYQMAATFLTRQGDPEAAIEKYREALKLAPNNLALTLGLGYLLVMQNHGLEAVDLLLPATDRYANSPDVHLLLGSAYYGLENLDQAIAEWRKALGLHDDPHLRQALARAEQERNVAGSYQELHTEHFLLRYEGSAPNSLADEVLKTLEQSFLDLERDLDVYPRETIVVLLYPNQAFRDITRSPSWVGALNDGKIRVPVSGISTMTLQVASVLKHELTHSFVRQATLGRCPVWFNEGLAQLEEGATTARYGTGLARSFSTLPAYSVLEGSFMDLPAQMAGMAYAKSLAAVEYMRDTFGMGEIRRLLKGLAGNPNFNSLLEEELRLNYPAFEQEVASYVEKRYGS